MSLPQKLSNWRPVWPYSKITRGDTMEDILKELDSAYQILFSITVSHDGVQKMAVAQAKLQKVYAELSKEDSANG